MNQPWVYMCPHLEPPSNLPPSHASGLSQCTSHPSAPALSALSHASNIDWWSVSHREIYMFQCYSLKSSYPHLLPQSPKVCSLYLCLFRYSLFTFFHWRRKWQPTPVFLPGESQGWQSLVGCHLWGLTGSDMTEAT